jgi:hypothetical protein
MARGDGELELSVGVRGTGGAAAAAADHVAPISLGRLILAGMVAGGVQYGWALQLSLLTPYVQVYIHTHIDVVLPTYPSSSPPTRARTYTCVRTCGGAACTASAVRVLLANKRYYRRSCMMFYIQPLFYKS